jgi:RNA polymerase sigma factor (sigma-70 family)
LLWAAAVLHFNLNFLKKIQIGERTMNKDYYILIGGEKISVNEDVYHAFKRPAWVERKRRQVRADHELSLEAFAEDGFDIPSGDPLVDEIVADRLLLELLMSALDRLNADERSLIDALFYEEKSEREVAKESGVSQNTVNYRKNRVLEKLHKFLERNF